MLMLYADLLLHQAEHRPEAIALCYRDSHWTYAALAEQTRAVAHGLRALGLARQERVAVYLPKRIETVTALYGTSLAGGTFVPVNPLLKPEQVGYILNDCNVRVLVTARDRYRLLAPILATCHDLHSVILIDAEDEPAAPGLRMLGWQALLTAPTQPLPRGIDLDMAAILYTSGSTGRPKGVVLSHRNLVCGAESVAQYLGNNPDDRILAVLPLSFDAGLSQLNTAFVAGARAVLLDYLLPQDVLKTAAREGITGITAVPPLWIQLAALAWPAQAQQSIRYIANTGGHMPRATLDKLRQALPHTTPFLMYGLTEAFRSTYLPPEELDRRPDSIGKAIPNADILVVREDGSPCAAGEPGELVHRGSLVALGYWNDPIKTAERFRPAPGRASGLVMPEIAVWSGDTVRTDEDGFLYFVGRKDDMIKTSGYRVSPTEIEEVIYASGQAAEAAALGIPHPVLGQAIVVVIKPLDPALFDSEIIISHCRQTLPNFMIPARITSRDTLPRNPNGKIDRKQLASELQHLFAPEDK